MNTIKSGLKKMIMMMEGVYLSLSVVYFNPWRVGAVVPFSNGVKRIDTIKTDRTTYFLGMV